MPIYEFKCSSCGRKVEIFVRSASASALKPCPHCGSTDLRRLVSRFAVHRAGDVFGSADEESYLDGLDQGDPQAMAAYARRMAEETGDANDPEVRRMLAQMESGSMPDGMDGGGDDDFDDDY